MQRIGTPEIIGAIFGIIAVDEWVSLVFDDSELVLGIANSGVGTEREQQRHRRIDSCP